MITSISFRNGHKAPPKSLGHLRLRELRRQPLQKFSQKAPQSPALKPPSTARTAGRSDWAERRFRRQPFILLSFSSSKKARKAQETQPYQRFQCIAHTDFNTSGTNGPRLLSRVKAGTHSAFGEGSYTRAHTPEQGLFRMGVVSLPSDCFTRFGNPAWPWLKTANFAALGSWPGGSQRTQRVFGTAMRLCVSLFRRHRGPAGLRDLFSLLSKLWLVCPALGIFRACEAWVVSLPSVRFACC